jgi:hypothetical protein
MKASSLIILGIFATLPGAQPRVAFNF